ncbi:MAG: hypothetical protein FJY11_00400 [Bacteroidetes bacterium]|nr:hypothetical protein [Bacteroidota bacterium]
MIPASATLPPYVRLSDIDVRNTDIYDDAWGFGQLFSDVITALSMVEPSAPDALVEGLLLRIEAGRMDGE